MDMEAKCGDGNEENGCASRYLVWRHTHARRTRNSPHHHTNQQGQQHAFITEQFEE